MLYTPAQVRPQKKADLATITFTLSSSETLTLNLADVPSFIFLTSPAHASEPEKSRSLDFYGTV